MMISFSWLKKYVKLPDSITPEEVADKLKMSTVEVESVKNAGAVLANVVVGKVITAEKHPNADRLKVCEVDVGNERIKIVCGGSNVTAGMLAVVAKNGAKVKWHGEGELVELKPTTIRGVESNGMICGSDEVGLVEMFPKKDEKEIVDLTALNLKPGRPLAEALGLNDAVLEIDNKSLSNRPDLWGHYGLAREVAVLTNREVEKYETKEVKPGKEIKIKIDIEDTKLCPRYMAVAISGVKVSESPEWLKQKLVAVGLRPINNIVDITNYVMFDLGQPMHAFDAQELTGQKEVKKVKITLRRAQENEPFVTLDGKERTLDTGMLIIEGQDGKPALIPGVMGGLHSGINENTTTVVFESANFEPSLIRKTSTKLGLRTDSSARFEKSLDPNWCPLAMAKAVELTLELCPGAKVVSNIADEKHFRLNTGPLEIPVKFFMQKIGLEIPVKTIVTTLTRLGFEIKEKKNSLVVKFPTWRATKDVSIAEDLVEEVVRIFGYDNIPALLPTFPITPPEKNILRDLENKVAGKLVKELGYTEVYNYSFVSASQIATLGEDQAKFIELDNPLSKEKPFLRRHLLSNLLENIVNNSADRDEVKIFEIGKVFRSELAGVRTEAKSDELLPRQDTYFTSVYTNKKNSVPFWESKRVIESLAGALGCDFTVKAPSLENSVSKKPYRHSARNAAVFLQNEYVGAIYEMHPMVMSRLGLDQRVSVAQINLTKLSEIAKDTAVGATYVSVPAYPEVSRDLAFLVKNEVTHAELSAAILKADQLMKQAELFDVFAGKNISAGYKSMAYHLKLGSAERTLNTEEVDKAIKKISDLLKKQFGAEIRV